MAPRGANSGEAAWLRARDSGREGAGTRSRSRGRPARACRRRWLGSFVGDSDKADCPRGRVLCPRGPGLTALMTAPELMVKDHLECREAVTDGP